MLSECLILCRLSKEEEEEEGVHEGGEKWDRKEERKRERKNGAQKTVCPCLSVWIPSSLY